MNCYRMCSTNNIYIEIYRLAPKRLCTLYETTHTIAFLVSTDYNSICLFSISTCYFVSFSFIRIEINCFATLESANVNGKYRFRLDRHVSA